MEEMKYLDYEGLVLFKNLLNTQRLADKTEIVGLLNGLSSNIGDGTLTIKRNGTTLNSFTANQISSSEVDISVPVSLGDLIDSTSYIKNIIEYGLPDVSELTEELKEALHNLSAEDSGFISEDALEDTLADYGTAINYDSTHQKIQLLHNNLVISEIDAADFIKDSMILNISVTDGTGDNLGLKVLLIDFNSDSGVQDIEIPISEFFNPDNYYTKTDFATVATSGNYADLSNTPDTLTQQEVNSGTSTTGKLVTAKIIKDTVNNAIYGGGDTSSSVITSDNLAEEVLDAGFAKSVKVGNNTPTIADENGVLFVPEQVLADWNVNNVNSKAFILNKPTVYSQAEIQNIIKYGQPDVSELTEEEKQTAEELQSQDSGYIKADDLATVATTGSYNDLLNKPTIPTDTNDLTNGAGFLTTHQDISGKANTSDLATVAFSGLYTDLINTPVIAEYRIVLDEVDDNKWYLTKNNTAVSSIEISSLLGVQSDWNQSDNTLLDFIKNKPTILSNADILALFNELVNIPESTIIKIDNLDTYVSLAGYVKLSDLATVANTGFYDDLTFTSNSSSNSSSSVTIDASKNLVKITTSVSISSIALSGVPENYHSCHVIVKGTESVSSVAIRNGYTYTIENETYTFVNPDNTDYSLSLSAGKYIEFDILRIDNELFIRGV